MIRAAVHFLHCRPICRVATSPKLRSVPKSPASPSFASKPPTSRSPRKPTRKILGLRPSANGCINCQKSLLRRQRFPARRTYPSATRRFRLLARRSCLPHRQRPWDARILARPTHFRVPKSKSPHMAPLHRNCKIRKAIASPSFSRFRTISVSRPMPTLVSSRIDPRRLRRQQSQLS